MIDKNDILTLEEVETLCRMYWDCRLSPLEEAQLQYVLLNGEYDSPLIRRTSAFLGVEASFGKTRTSAPVRKPFYRRFSFYGAAALLALLLATAALFLAGNDARNEPEANLMAQNTEQPELEAENSTSEPRDELTLSQHEPAPTSKTVAKTVAKQRCEVAQNESCHDDQPGNYRLICDEEDAAEVIENVQTRLNKLIAKSIDAGEKVPSVNEITSKFI